MTDDYDAHRFMPDDYPHKDLYWSVVPIWSDGTEETDDWEKYGCGYSFGFEVGIIMAMLRPEWAQGFYHKLRAYYMRTHTEEDLKDWDGCADETARAIPITSVG